MSLHSKPRLNPRDHGAQCSKHLVTCRLTAQNMSSSHTTTTVEISDADSPSTPLGGHHYRQTDSVDSESGPSCPFLEFSTSVSRKKKISTRQQGRQRTSASKCDESKLRSDWDSSTCHNERPAFSEQQKRCHPHLEASNRSFADRRLTEQILQKYSGVTLSPALMVDLPKPEAAATTLKVYSKDTQPAPLLRRKQHRRDTGITRAFTKDGVTANSRADARYHHSSPASLNFDTSNHPTMNKGATSRPKSVNKESRLNSRLDHRLESNGLRDGLEKAYTKPTIGKASNHSKKGTKQSSKRLGSSESKLKSNGRRDQLEKACSAPTLREILGLCHDGVEQQRDDTRRCDQLEGGRSPSQKLNDKHKRQQRPAPLIDDEDFLDSDVAVMDKDDVDENDDGP
jgi:hypothetical protein